MGLIRFLGILIIFYAVWTVLRRWVFPLLGKYLLRKAGEQMQHQMNQQMSSSGKTNNERVFRSGNVEITQTKSEKKKSSQDQNDGEYIDFEELN